MCLWLNSFNSDDLPLPGELLKQNRPSLGFPATKPVWYVKTSQSPYYTWIKRSWGTNELVTSMKRYHLIVSVKMCYLNIACCWLYCYSTDQEEKWHLSWLVICSEEMLSIFQSFSGRLHAVCCSISAKRESWSVLQCTSDCMGCLLS